MAGETEEIGDGDNLVASDFELGDDGLHRLDGALVRVVEEEDAAVFHTVKGHCDTILNGHIGSPVSAAQAGDEDFPAKKFGDVSVVCRERWTEVRRLHSGISLDQ